MKYGDEIYYQNELEDEIIDFKINKKKIDENYKYIHKNIFYRFFSCLSYRLIALPIAFFFKLNHHIHFKNKKILKPFKKTGYFIYGNHTNQFSDGFSPALINHAKKPYLIVNSDNVSMPFLGKLTPMWGALPLPDNLAAGKNFHQAIKYHVDKHHPIIIYPEAHLWPYYTKIRPFDSKSFRYPVEYNKPAFTFTTTYHLRKQGKRPRIDIYVDGPFYPDESLDIQSRRQKLRDEVYSKMCERASLSDYEYVKYIRRKKDD